MKIVIQRVKKAKLYIGNYLKGGIKKGMVVFVGIGKGDTEDKLDYFVKKIAFLRIFEDENGKMNYSILDIGGEIMVVSQFTLYGDCKKGNRPDFSEAEKPEIAKILFEKFIEKIKKLHIRIVEGEFGKKMKVDICNNGPCTFILEK